MTEPQMSMREVRAEADRLVFKAGGWLTVANRLEMTHDALRRRFQPAASITNARAWLCYLRSALAGEETLVPLDE